MAYQFYQNAKMVQNQVGQSEDAVNQSIQNSVNEYKQNFAQANYAYAVNLAQEEAGKTIGKMMGETELLTAIPATFNALKSGIPAAKNIVYKIKGEPTPDKKPNLTDDTSKPELDTISEALPEGPTEISGLVGEAPGKSDFLPDTVDETGKRPKMTIPDEPVISDSEKTFQNPFFGKDLGVSTSAEQALPTQITRQQFGSADYTGTQTGKEPTPVLPTEEQPTISGASISGASNVLDKTGSDIITSEVQETAGNIEKTASKSIWEEIGDTFADIGEAALDIVDPIADVVEAGVAVAGVAIGAKSIADADKPTDLPPPTMQKQSLLQTSSISDVMQPGI